MESKSEKSKEKYEKEVSQKNVMFEKSTERSGMSEEVEERKSHRKENFEKIEADFVTDCESSQYCIKSLLLLEKDRKCLDIGDWLSYVHHVRMQHQCC